MKNFLPRVIPPLVWLGFIFFISTDVGSEPHTEVLLEPCLEWLGEKMPEAQMQELNRQIRDLAHSAEYAVFGVLLWIGFRRLLGPNAGIGKRLALGLASVAVCAVSDERFQSLFHSRHSDFEDVLRDLAGGALALGGMAALEWRRPRKAAISPRPDAGGERRRSRPPAARGRRVLLTAALSLHRAEAETVRQLRAAVAYTEPDVCVVAGDLGPADRAPRWLDILRAAAGPAELVICLGNEDHWIDKRCWDAAPSAAEVRDQFWRPAVMAADVRCLDFANAEFPDLILAGGFGHYDLGFRDGDLALNGAVCRPADYQGGSWMGLECEDFAHVPNLARTLPEAAEREAAEISARLAAARETGKAAILVTHTAPFADLIATSRSRTPASRFQRAYAGNAALGAALAASARGTELVVCGHGGAGLSPELRDGIFGINLERRRSGALSFALFDSRAVRSTACRFAIDAVGRAINPR